MTRIAGARLVALIAAVVAITVGVALALNAPRNDAGTAEVVGVVVEVDGAGLGDVRGFTLRVPGGELLTFGLRALENGAEFPPGHLAEHQVTAAPVRVVYRVEGGERLAIRLEDAPR